MPIYFGRQQQEIQAIENGVGNRFIFGNDDHLKDITQALALLKNYKYEGGEGKSNNIKDESAGVAFVQSGRAAVASDSTRDKSKY